MSVAWITGARGFIGRHLAAALGQQGTVVCGVGHGQLRPELWRAAGLASWMDSPLAPEALSQLAAAHGLPQVVFHLAGGSAVGASMQAPLEDFRRTTAATAVLLEWLRSHTPHSQVVVASSAAVYGDTRGAAAAESRPAAPESPYGYHKLMMEQLCQEYSRLFGLQTAVLRLFSVYGEGLRKQLLWDCSMKFVAEGESIELAGSGEELRDWVHVDDAVVLLQRLAAVASEACPVVNGGSGVGVRVRDVVALLGRALQRPKQLTFSGVCRRGDPRTLVADTARVSALGYRARVSLELGVQRYADWFARSRNG